MRYRRLSYRYALVVAGAQLRPWSDARPAERASVRLAQTFWRPPADVCESANTVAVTVDLAGIDQDAVDVALSEDFLVIEGQRQLPPPPEGVYYAAEIQQGPFRLEVALPAAIDLDRVEARYDRGLLRITLPKRATATR